MDSLDLDINNYNLNDILNLFKIPSNFTESDIKNAKKIVLKIHPDKSKLPPDYFRFYLKAYKMLYSVWEFRKKGEVNINEANTDYEKISDEDKTQILDNFFDKNDILKKNNKQFNNWFNEQFEKQKIYNENVETGYGDWLKSSEGIEEERVTSLSQMKNVFDKRKTEARSLIVKKDIEDFNGGSGLLASELSQDAPQSFDSDLYSSLPFQDLQKAHCESVIPVTEEDYHNRKKFSNVNELMTHRNTQNTKPLSESQALEYLNNRENIEDDKATKRGYQLAKEAEETRRKDEDFWSNLRRIKN